MKKSYLIVLIFLFTFSGFGQTDSLPEIPEWTGNSCERGKELALADAKKGKYKLYEFGMKITFSMYESAFNKFYEEYILEKYNIEIFDGGCTVYPNGECYTKKMKKLLIKKHGEGFFERIKKEAKTLYNKNIQTKIDTGFIFNFTDSMPQFVGGEKKLFEYLGKNTKYPHHSCINGTVYCQFVVEKDGGLSSFKILRSLDKKIDTIVLNAIVSMPNWKPAQINNQPVRCKMILPFKFTLR